MNEIPDKMGIYLLRNKLSNKIYIGKSVHLHARMRSHKWSKKSKESSHIINAIKKYGWESFDIEILLEFDNIDNNVLLFLESSIIYFYNSTDRTIGYNILKYSSDWTGRKHSKETKEKLSRLGKERFKNKPGFNLGKKASIETRQKISKAGMGRTPWNIGIPWTTEHKEKLSIIKIGTKLSQKTKNKMSESAKKTDKTYLKKKVKQIDKNSGEIIKIWNSISDASCFYSKNKTNCGVSMITSVCLKKPDKRGYFKKSAYGFLWEFI